MNRKQKKMLVRIVVAAAMLIGFHFIPLTGWWRFALYLVPYLVIGYDILLKAAKGLARRQVFDENFLMAVATLGAMAIGLVGHGDYVEAIAVMLFYQIGEWFQSYAVGKSRKSICALLDIRPDYANLEADGVLTQVDPNEVAVGTVIVVKPGERIPLDGVVTDGTSELNTSALTGESMPCSVRAGDAVVSGCINLTGVLHVRTTKVFGESTVTKILELTENASARKARSEQIITRFAHVYTPIVCGLAVLLAVLPPVVGLLSGTGAAWSKWVYRALSFLVASCPCALVVSIPLCFFAGLGGASKQGVLVKGASYLEALAHTKTVVFDKTGTLTQGEFAVTEVHALSCSQEQLLAYAALAESSSSHPIATSLLRAHGAPLDRSRVTDVTEQSGYGVTATVDGVRVAVGGDKWMTRLGIAFSACSDAGTAVHVALDGTYAGRIVISDTVKPSSVRAIDALRHAGVKRTVMLTGDKRSVAERVAHTLGIDSVYSDLLPADKVDRVEQILKEQPPRARTAFVGDGINDAPVLSRADVGIAMGAMGSDAAIEAADVVLMDDDPQKVATAIRIAKKCMRIVTQNIVFSLAVKLAALVLVACGVANMWIAIFADVGVTVLCVLNAIRALFPKRT